MDSSLDPIFDAAGRQYDIDPTVLKALALQESAGNPNTAPSKAGAIGLMQFMPATAKAVGIDPTNPTEAIFGAAKLLDQNLKQYGNLPDALKAYNAGNPTRWNNPETAAYVPGVAAKYQQIVANKRTPTGAAAADDALLGTFLGSPEKPSAGASESAAPTVAPGDDQLLKGFLASPAPATPAPASTPAPQQASATPATMTTPPGVPQGVHDAANTIVAGANRAMHDVLDLPVRGGAYLADLIGLTQGAGPAQQASQAQALQDYTSRYGGNPLAQGVRIAGDVGLTLLPTAGVGSAVTGAGNALLGTGNALARIGTGIASGAAQGAAGGLLTAGSSEQPLADQMKTGAIVGGALGGAVPVVANALGAGKISPEIAGIAKDAQKLGIPIYGGQISANPMVKFANSVVNKLPLSGAEPAMEAQQTAINRTIAASMGQQANKVTPAVMDAARRDTGKIFDEVANKVTFPADQQLLSNLGRIQTDIGFLPVSEQNAIEKHLNNVLDVAVNGGGDISGKAYQALTAKGSPLDVAMQKGDPNIRYYASQIKDALDDALERYTPPELQAKLTQARSQWKAMKTVEDLAETHPSGDIPATSLMGPVRKAYGGGGPLGMAYNTDAPELVKLARLGPYIREPQSSGTAERLAVMSQLGNPLAWGPMLATLGTGRALGAGLRSDAFTNMLLNPGASGVSPLALQTARRLEDLREQRSP